VVGGAVDAVVTGATDVDVVVAIVVAIVVVVVVVVSGATVVVGAALVVVVAAAVEPVAADGEFALHAEPIMAAAAKNSPPLASRMPEG
jgi:hypothetical protein